MNSTTNFMAIILVFLVLFTASAVAAYWKERSEGYSHAASVRASFILLAILFGNATINFVVNVAHR